MSSEARRRAERCFALARSTTFGPERETAIAKGTAIAEAAGLSLDAFDIPGRARAAGPRSDHLFEGNGIFRGGSYTYAGWGPTRASDLMDEINRMFEEERAGRRQAEDVAAERTRRQRQRDVNKLDDCLNWLFSRGLRVYPANRAVDGTVIYSAPEERPGADLTEADVLRLARNRGWTR